MSPADVRYFYRRAREAGWTSADGQRDQARQRQKPARIHRQQPRPAELPDVGISAIHEITDEDQQLFHAAFGREHNLDGDEHAPDPETFTVERTGASGVAGDPDPGRATDRQP